MSNFVVLVVTAVIGGIAVVLQAQFMGVMDQSLGTLESVFITYGSGGILVGLTMLLLRGGNLAAWRTLPWYAPLAGVAGLIIVGSIGYVTPRLGLVATFTIFVAAQFIFGALIDHFGLLGAEVRSIDLSTLAGMVIVLVGVWLIVK
ncbi:MAG: DMT family transporter [Ardenticatenaceae bacterium]|nr:DMT family transporter [Ardenticatenaceae bacterium]MCB9443192.1 DMT family transporter [Ardenticatenaceae bacterium]